MFWRKQGGSWILALFGDTFGHFGALLRRKSGTACLWLSVLLRIISWNKIAAVVAQVLTQVLAVIVERAMAI
jgi:hypothetical protein